MVLDPARLGAGVDVAVEADLEGFPGFKRMVNQNGGAVRNVFIGGSEAVSAGQVVPALGRRTGFGRLLRATA